MRGKQGGGVDSGGVGERTEGRPAPEQGRQLWVAIAGAPGSGKTTLAVRVVVLSEGIPFVFIYFFLGGGGEVAKGATRSMLRRASWAPRRSVSVLHFPRALWKQVQDSRDFFQCVCVFFLCLILSLFGARFVGCRAIIDHEAHLCPRTRKSASFRVMWHSIAAFVCRFSAPPTAPRASRPFLSCPSRRRKPQRNPILS